MIAAVAAAAAGYALERRWARRFEAADHAAGHDLGLPPDVERHHVPTCDGGTSHVVTAGSGRPVVLLHGITMQAEAWAYQFALRDRARLVAVDLRGHGRSRLGADGADLGRCARDVRDLLEAFDLRDAILVGHSLGGMVIGQLLHDHPAVVADRVGGHLLLATAGKATLALPTPVVAALADRMVADAAGGGRLSSRLRRVPRSDLGEWALRQAFGRHPSRRHVDALAQAFESVPAPAYASLVRSLVGFDALAAWSAVGRPVTIAVGERDRIVPPRASDALARAIPHARYERLPDAGHMLMYERPDGVNALLADLVAS